MNELESLGRRIKEVNPELHPVLKRKELEAIYLAVFRYGSRDDLSPGENAVVLDMLFDLYKLIEPLLDDRED